MRKLTLIIALGSLAVIIGCGGQPKPIVSDDYANKVHPPSVSDEIKSNKPIVDNKYANKVKVPKVPNYSNGKYSKMPIKPKF